MGAPQKKFAWIIGIALAAAMFVLFIILNTFSIFTGIICLICLIFLFFESAFGICLGCLFYGWFYKDKAQYCPGEVCYTKNKQAIQKTSGVQIMIVAGLVAYILLAVYFLHGYLSETPVSLWDKFR